MARLGYEGLASRLASELARIDRAGAVSKMNQHKTHRTPLGPTASALEEAEPILVLTRREGASFVLDLTCDRLALHAPALPISTCVITCVPCAVTCERLSKSIMRWFIP